jgi:hypothetical protein
MLTFFIINIRFDILTAWSAARQAAFLCRAMS